MSIGQPQSGIRFSGLSSGIDVESIVTQLVSIESIGRQRIQAQKAQVEGRQIIYGQLRSNILAFNGAVSSLNSPSAYQSVTASSSDADSASISATSSASAGIYSLKVSQLAQSHKVSSAAQESTTSALGQAGSFDLNGVSIEIEATDTLQTIAGKINGSKAGVRASLINGGEGQAYMTLSASKSGEENAIEFSNFVGGAADALGFNGIKSFLNQPAANTVRSSVFSSSSATLASLSIGTGTKSFDLDGVTFSIDADTQSLQDIANTINTQFSGTPERVSAQVVADGANFRLELSGSEVPASLEDTDALFEDLGFYENKPYRELVKAQDAEYTLDGVSFKSASNEVTTVLPGASFSLKKADPSKEITLSLNSDTTKVKDSLQSLVDAYNNLNGYIRQNTQFDADSLSGGPLLGDSITAQLQSSVTSVLFNNVGTGDVRNLADLGVLFDSEGALKLDSSRLNTVLAENPDAVRNILADSGSTSTSQLVYVNGSSKAKSSGSAGYEVNITQAATQSRVEAGMAPSGANVGGEVLTFSGSLFGSASFTITSSVGDSLQDLADKVNQSANFKDRLTASVEGGKLTFVSKNFGASTAFQVTSNLAADNDNSGIGTTGGTATAGLNIAGTINGEAATGSGQFLIGSEDNANTEGLQIQYTGAATGVVGTVSFTSGLSQRITSVLSSFTDSVDGILTANDNSIKDQIKDFDVRLDELADQLQLREAFLRQRFAVMEQAIASLNAQQSQIGAITSGFGNG
jgi:flagellar hook-associated protein 2